MKKCLLLLFLIFLPSCWAKTDEPDQAEVDIAQPAPIFMLKDLNDQWVSLRDFCGNLRQPWKNKTKYNVIISYWATYCVPCKKEIPKLIELEAKYKNSVKLLLLSIDKEGKPMVAPHAEKKEYFATILLDKYHRTARRYGVKSVPALFLVDREGIVRFMHYGYDKAKGLEGLEKALAPLIEVTDQ